MKRIALLACGALLLVANTAEARRFRYSNNVTYSQPASVAPATYTALKPSVQTIPATSPSESDDTTSATSPTESDQAIPTTSPSESVQLTSATLPTPSVPVTPVSYSTSTAQGVANIMASRNQVGHWGGNPGYEGCGCGATPAAAYAICCYGNSGMATVDVGYARSANGMWYCCRRYR